MSWIFARRLLYERAAMGIRPVLYVSSRKDFECSVRIVAA